VGRLLWIDDREPNPQAIINPSMAQYHLWLAQIQRDHGRYSDKEMARMELKATAPARRAKTLFNPFSGEIRQLNSNGEIEQPCSVFLGRSTNAIAV
jgi:hypothetical protein